jgi:general stress protein YciG
LGKTIIRELASLDGFSRRAFLDEEGSLMANRKLTRSEAGRKGGKTTLKKYGTEFYQKIGQKGGRKGGQTTKERYGTKFYQEIGRRGGLK